MSINYNPKIVVRPRAKPARIVMTESQQGTVEPRGKTWGIRVRGDVSKVAPQTYRCPVHGDFVVEVPLSAVPDEQMCQAVETRVVGYGGMLGGDELYRDYLCGHASSWAGTSSCGIGHAAGEVES